VAARTRPGEGTTVRRPWIRRVLSYGDRSLAVTRAGFAFLLLTLAVGFAAINTGSNLLHAVFGAQMTLILASGVLSDRMVVGVTVRRRAPAPLFAGVPGVVEVLFENPHPRRVVLSVHCMDDGETADAPSLDVAPAYAAVVPPRGRVVRSVRATAHRRGVWSLPSAVVITKFPFGLFEKRRRLGPGDPVLVYPRLCDGPVRFTGRGRHGDTEQARGGRTARDGAFFALREYRRGDEPRKIAWRPSARARTLLVREERSHGAEVVTLHLAPGTAGARAFETAVERTAAAARRLLRSEGRTVALRYGAEQVVPPGAGPHHLDRILTFLATCGASPGGDAARDPTLAPPR